MQRTVLLNIMYRSGESPRVFYPSARECIRTSNMRIRFHKILNEGRSVRYEKRPEERDVIDLNIIVMKDQRARGHE